MNPTTIEPLAGSSERTAACTSHSKATRICTKKEASFASTWQPSERWLTSVGLRPDLSSLGVLGSVTLAPLSRLGVSEEGSHESPDPADPLAADRMLRGKKQTVAYVENDF